MPPASHTKLDGTRHLNHGPNKQTLNLAMKEAMRIAPQITLCSSSEGVRISLMKHVVEDVHQGSQR